MTPTKTAPTTRPDYTYREIEPLVYEVQYLTPEAREWSNCRSEIVRFWQLEDRVEMLELEGRVGLELPTLQPEETPNPWMTAVALLVVAGFVFLVGWWVWPGVVALAWEVGK
jgi:hypothetical protein